MCLSLEQRWRSAGVMESDVLLVHSNIKRTLLEFRRMGFSITPSEILDSLLRVLGDGGTLLLPLFNFDFTNGVGFDFNSTPSQMGALTEVARKYPGAVRTGHPVYSFAAIGARSQEFERVDNISAYGDDSPFALLREMGGKIAVIDLPDNGSMTFYHHVEELLGVSYRYHKCFSGPYTDKNGVREVKTYSIYVRDLSRGVVTTVDPAGELMWEKGLYRGFRPGVGPGMRLVDSRQMFSFVSEIISEGRAEGLLYGIERESV